MAVSGSRGPPQSHRVGVSGISGHVACSLPAPHQRPAAAAVCQLRAPRSAPALSHTPLPARPLTAHARLSRRRPVRLRQRRPFVRPSQQALSVRQSRMRRAPAAPQHGAAARGAKHMDGHRGRHYRTETRTQVNKQQNRPKTDGRTRLDLVLIIKLRSASGNHLRGQMSLEQTDTKDDGHTSFVRRLICVSLAGIMTPPSPQTVHSHGRVQGVIQFVHHLTHSQHQQHKQKKEQRPR